MNKPKILILESDDFLCQTLKGTLIKSGLAVTTANSGKVGAELLKQHIYDVVVTDLNLPYVGGMEIANKVKNDPRSAHTAVLAISAVANEAIIEASFTAGADEFQKIPVVQSEFAVRVAKLAQKNNRMSVAS